MDVLHRKGLALLHLDNEALRLKVHIEFVASVIFDQEFGFMCHMNAYRFRRGPRLGLERHRSHRPEFTRWGFGLVLIRSSRCRDEEFTQ